MEDEKNSNKDGLGDRMKNYEGITRTYLLPRSYVFCRVDGRAFHSYLRGCKRPFDIDVMNDMDATAVYLCENVQNVKLGYVQSDEITLLLCDFDSYETSQFFDGNIQKISSVVASMAAAKFNQLRWLRQFNSYVKNADTMDWNKMATFDCRCWVVPTQWEAANVFVWRNQDYARNSVSMVAQANFSHKELQGKSTKDMHEMLHAKGVNWAEDYTDREKNGALVVKKTYTDTISVPDVANFKVVPKVVERNKWVAIGTYKFTEGKDCLLSLIPTYPA